MRVRLSAEAREDLRSIARYVARDNPLRASTLVRDLVRKAEKLAEMPERFPLVQRYAHLGIRRRIWEKYLIFYRVEDEGVMVIHILHGARDYDVLLFPDE